MFPVLRGVDDVVVATQYEEAVLGVLVDRRFAAKHAIERKRFRDHVRGERVVAVECRLLFANDFGGGHDADFRR